MQIKIAEFTTMWTKYASELTVIDKAFSKANSPNTSDATRNWVNSAFSNTCCVRVSYAFNHTISQRITATKTAAAGLLSSQCVTGKNGKYIFRVPDLSKYLRSQYGRPIYEWSSSDQRERLDFWNEINEKRGVLSLIHI